MTRPTISSLLTLATRAIHFARADEPLGYFEPVASMPGFPRAMAATLAELRLQGVTVSQLAEGSARARDIGRILGRFEAELEDHQLVDMATVFEVAAGAVAARIVETL